MSALFDTDAATPTDPTVPPSATEVTGEAEPVAPMLRAGGCGPHQVVHPTRSRQPVGITSYRGHPTPVPLSFRDSLLMALVLSHGSLIAGFGALALIAGVGWAGQQMFQRHREERDNE